MDVQGVRKELEKGEDEMTILLIIWLTWGIVFCPALLKMGGWNV